MRGLRHTDPPSLRQVFVMNGQDPDWWFERGERDQAHALATRLRHFIADSRLMSPTELRQLEIAQITLEAHRAAR